MRWSLRRHGIDVDAERFLTIQYVSDFAEVLRSVFIRTQIETVAISGDHRATSWATRERDRNDSQEAMNDTNSHKAEALV